MVYTDFKAAGLSFFGAIRQNLHVINLLVIVCTIFGITLLLATPPPGILSASEQQRLIDRFGSRVMEKFNLWQNVFDKQVSASEWGQLHLVNTFFNSIPYVSDAEHWGVEDYWATPAELLASNGGDCEDFAIAKLFSLLAGGIPANKLRLMYATNAGKSHMVLIYNESPNSVPLVLDNLRNEILPANQRGDLVPVYSFNTNGLWLTYSHGLGEKLRNDSGSDLWDALMVRLEPKQLSVQIQQAPASGPLP